jgi:hypothetical protein
MIERLTNWLKERFGSEEPPPPRNFRRAGTFVTRPRTPSSKQLDAVSVEHETGLSGKIEDAGPGKTVLIRNKYVREDTGTHDTLKILDESLIDSGEDPGIDPYNTGGFDRSKNWNKRFSK